MLLPLLVIVLVGCDPAPKATSDAAAKAALSLFDTFGDLRHDVATRVPLAQRYFDQGLRMAYGFNHEAAGRSFAEAARLDPQCAMCVWGRALVLVPNINMAIDPVHAKEATALAARAASLAATARPVDRTLIQALQLRYADPAPADRACNARAVMAGHPDVSRRSRWPAPTRRPDSRAVARTCRGCNGGSAGHGPVALVGTAAGYATHGGAY